MIFHTITCTCGWNYGPAPKKRAKMMLAFHKEIHRLEKMTQDDWPEPPEPFAKPANPRE